MKTLAELAVRDVVEEDQESDEDEDEKKRTKKQAPHWSFSLLGIDDEEIEIEKGSEAAELIEKIAEEYQVLDDLLKTAANLGYELVKEKSKARSIVFCHGPRNLTPGVSRIEFWLKSTTLGLLKKISPEYSRYAWTDFIENLNPLPISS